jgi:hypothetical protein
MFAHMICGFGFSEFLVMYKNDCDSILMNVLDM